MTPMMVPGEMSDRVLPGGMETVGFAVDDITGTTRLIVIILYTIGTVLWVCIESIDTQSHFVK